MAALVASPSWTQSLPYAPQHSYSSQYNSYNQRPQTPLRQSSATWNTKFPAGLSLDLSLPAAAPPRMPVYTSSAPSPSYVPAKPRLRLATSSEQHQLPSRRFDPFADEPQPVASTSALPPPSPSPSQGRQNTPPPARGRALTPLSITITTSTSTSSTPSSTGPSSPAPPPQGRRRAPSFSAGSGSPRSSLSLASLSALTPSPAPSLTRATLYSSSSSSSSKVVEVPLAPTPFHARHYPTPDARARLLARTLLNRIHAVGRPRSLYSCSAYSKTRCGNGYESECGSRGYVPSRLSECVCVAC